MESWSGCLRISDGNGWNFVKNCNKISPFICGFQTFTPVSSNTSLHYTSDNLTFSSFYVKLTYQSSGQAVDRKITGFRLIWYIIKESDGGQVTEAAPRYTEDNLVSIVKIAGKAQRKNMTEDEITSKVIQESALIKSLGSCPYGQVEDEKFMEQVFLKLNNLAASDEIENITDEDIVTWFSLYSVLLYCPEEETLKIFQFLHELISSHSPRTIIQATVNTIQSDGILKTYNRNFLGQYYQTLDKIFNFQLGKILLALSSTIEIRNMMEKNFPYFLQYREQIEQYLSGRGIQEVIDLVQEIGD